MTSLAAAAPAEYECKEILATLDTRPWFDAEMLATANWLSEYYLCSPAEAMRLFIPGKTSILNYKPACSFKEAALSVRSHGRSISVRPIWP